MKHLSLGYTALGLGVLALASCGADETTAPTKAPTVAGPELAIAHNTWLARGDMWSVERWDLAVATVTNAAGQSVVYAIGGRSAAGAPLGKVMAYNVSTNTWTLKASLPSPLSATNGAGVVNGKIYVSGGLFGKPWPYWGVSSTLYMYNPTTNVWTAKARMPEQGAWGVTGAIGGKLYVLSTCVEEPFSGANYYDTCEPSKFFRYNPATNRWATLPRPQGTYDMGAVLYDKLYVTDGQKLEVYDPATNQWTAKASGGQGRIDGAAVAQGAMLYLIGGRELIPDVGWQPLRTVKVYHPMTNTWTTAAPLPTARYGIAATKVFLNGGPRIEVVGGSAPGNNLQYIP